MPDSRGLVLVVDDDQDWIEAISAFLLEEGYLVVVASNGLEALEMLSHLRPFVVVTDIQMPVMDGRQLLVMVHAQDAGVPVIIVTGEQVQDHDASLAEAFRVIRKPVPVEDLLSAMVAAKARRAVHLPLPRLWLAAGAASQSHEKLVSRMRRGTPSRAGSPPRFSAVIRGVILTFAVASSVALFAYWRGKIS